MKAYLKALVPMSAVAEDAPTIILLAVLAVSSLAVQPNMLDAEGGPQAPGKASAAAGPADLVLTNGVIYTVDPARPRVEAVAIRGEGVFETLREIAKLVLAELKKGT